VSKRCLEAGNMRAALHLDIGKKGPSIPLDTLFSTASTPAIPG
jgi:hypothetical protein